MDPRIAKFSLDSDQLAALEAAIQCLIGLDAFECLEKKDERGAARRFAVLVERADRVGKLHIRAFVQSRAELEALLRQVCPEFRSQIIIGFNKASRLHATLAMIEVLTVQPYAGSEETRKFSVSDDARNSVAEFIATAVDFDGRIPSATVKTVRSALEETNGVFSQLWKRVGIFVLAAVVTGVTGVFAGPLIGGLIGTYLLGLSGAAAVSAGLALLGGGALTAGGFGMIGGTVVIAAAFGAAGAGASQAFLGKDGAVIAQIATIRHLAAFGALDRVQMLDHQLADDFRESLELQKAQYDTIAKGKDKESKEAEKVVSVLEKAMEWLNDSYAKAVREKRVRRDPVAWAPPARPKAEAIPNKDFAALAAAIQERHQMLEHCALFLRNAGRTYADVKDANFMVALLKQFNGATRQRLMAGHELLQCALAEIISLVDASRRDLEQLVSLADKIATTHDELSKRDTIIQQYESMLCDLLRHVRQAIETNSALREENGALREEIEQQDRALARAILLASIIRATHSQKILAEKNAAQGQVDIPRQTDLGDDSYTAKVDLAIAMLVEPDDDALREILNRAQEIGLAMTRNELAEIMDSLDLPLGAPAESVRARYRERFAEVHPDRHLSASGAMERMLKAQRARLNLARDIHFRYLGTRMSAEES